MIYSIEELISYGAQYPPKSEIKRRDGYRVNDMLLNDEPWNALPEYKQRVFSILSNFQTAQREAYFYDANYWADLVEKMQELIYGDAPNYTGTNDLQTATLTETLEATNFAEKAIEGLSDFVSLGEWVTKVERTSDGCRFINVDPATWYPIVSRENVKEVKAHVLAWLVKVGKDKRELHVQIHERGKYTNRAFAVDKYEPEAYYKDEKDGRRIACPLATIGRELEKSVTDFALGEFSNGFNDKFAIIATANNARTRTIYGVSDFDKITEGAMEYNVRMTLKNLVLDKHSAPIMYGAPLDGDGEGDLGNYIEVPTNGTPPNYLVWDASMQSVENTILKTQEDIANLSGLGSLLSSKTFGESQGYDALMIKLAPALMKAARKRAVLGSHLKELLSMLSEGYGERVPARDITIGWKNGIPTTEGVRADIAQKHLATGWSMFDVLTKDYGWTEEAAKLAIERKKEETPAIPSYGMLGNEGGDDEA